jgi:hypothetical protein
MGIKVVCTLQDLFCERNETKVSNKSHQSAANFVQNGNNLDRLSGSPACMRYNWNGILCNCIGMWTHLTKCTLFVLLLVQIQARLILRLQVLNATHSLHYGLLRCGHSIFRSSFLALGLILPIDLVLLQTRRLCPICPGVWKGNRPPMLNSSEAPGQPDSCPNTPYTCAIPPHSSLHTDFDRTQWR